MPSPDSTPTESPPPHSSTAPGNPAASSGQKRAAPPPEGPARKVVTVEQPRDPRDVDITKILNSLPKYSPTRATLEHALEAFSLVANDMALAQTPSGWATVCTHLASAPVVAAQHLQPGDEIEDTQAVNHVRDALQEAARSLQGDVTMEDEPRETTPAPPNVAPIADPTTRDVLLLIQKQCSALNSRLARLEKQTTQRTAPQRASAPTPPTPENASPTYANAVREAPKPNSSSQTQSQ
ncbi:uncharacterized protein SCHCODRAFT_02458967, partial [Schizophyllum commune H4-8]|uniref:uncharacterized protein n=1 Tax=Schizophyllum commune (strain H4-8 / FGSC 9210) TaxID=578458 RepID=UPI0021605EA0